MNLRRLSLKQRLALGFGSVLAVVGVSLAFGWLHMAEETAKLEAVSRLNARASQASRWEAMTQLNIARTLAVLRSDAHADLHQLFDSEIKKTSGDIDAVLDTLEKDNATDSEGPLLDKVKQERQRYLHARTVMLEASHDGDLARAEQTFQEEVLPSAGSYQVALQAYRKRLASLSESVDSDARASVGVARRVFVVAGAIGLAIAILAIGIIYRSVTSDLGLDPREATAVLRRVAEGDLSERIELRSRDPQSLAAQINEMQDSLARLVVKVRNTAELVASTSVQIAQGNQDLSDRTEQQSEILFQAAAAMQQLGTTVEQNVRNASNGNELAQGTVEVAQRGGGVVLEVVRTMKGISESSRQIADITSIIDSIAFQTNILALNAAVEAARAGDHGRGFAVVAGEVRRLAQRSAEAARQIKDLIESSVLRIEEGGRLADQAGDTMQEVVASISRVTEIIAGINESSVEQSAEVAGTAASIRSMGRTNEKNANLVKDSAAAADHLKQQAEEVVSAVAAFKVGDDEALVEA